MVTRKGFWLMSVTEHLEFAIAFPTENDSEYIVDIARPLNTAQGGPRIPHLRHADQGLEIIWISKKKIVCGEGGPLPEVLLVNI